MTFIPGNQLSEKLEDNPEIKDKVDEQPNQTNQDKLCNKSNSSIDLER